MNKLPIWTWVLIVLIAADLLLAVTGTGILIREQRGHAWAMQGDQLDLTKRRIPMLGCTYWTGLGTKLVPYPFPSPTQHCAPIRR